LAEKAIQAGAIAIRTDVPIKINRPIIGLRKSNVVNREKEAYITNNINAIYYVAQWADYVAIDFRKLNPFLDEINKFCIDNRIKVVADISEIEDYENILTKNYQVKYAATTLSIFKTECVVAFVKQLKDRGCECIIAEGGYKNNERVRMAIANGANNVCIGGAISDIKKLTGGFVNEFCS
jgi:putative N-acetylmannosamine-6-phosphate epimerase